MCCVGGGAVISDANKELKELVEKIQAPVGDTLMGKGAFDGTDEKYTGMVRNAWNQDIELWASQSAIF